MAGSPSLHPATNNSTSRRLANSRPPIRTAFNRRPRSPIRAQRRNVPSHTGSLQPATDRGKSPACCGFISLLRFTIRAVPGARNPPSLFEVWASRAKNSLPCVGCFTSYILRATDDSSKLFSGDHRSLPPSTSPASSLGWPAGGLSAKATHRRPNDRRASLRNFASR